MTTTTEISPFRQPPADVEAPADDAPARPRSEQVTFSRVVAAEWTKLRSVRSTWAILAIGAALTLGLAAVIGYGLSGGTVGPGNRSGPPNAPTDTVGQILAATTLTALLIGVLGALAMSTEYSTGTITATLTALPRRWMALAAKAVVVVLVVAPVSIALSAASVLTASAFLSGDAVVQLADPGVPGAILGNAGYLTAVALLGLGLATVLRSTTGTITVLVGVVFVLPPLLPLIPWEWVSTMADHFPAAAGSSLTVVGGGATLTDYAATLTLALWALIPLALGAMALQKKDV